MCLWRSGVELCQPRLERHRCYNLGQRPRREPCLPPDGFPFPQECLKISCEKMENRCMSDSLQEASSMANTSVMDKLIFTGREHVKASKTTFFRHERPLIKHFKHVGNGDV
ncbi:hypothetical protein Y1Q_0021310 [Alligator mississippiensis]|uniref:Uncharacterized protein n=1 Tax=Alligator mississippiensis TaxID=8496 RepID=A0A151P960_ALLMI|nr:hypothetical protein Y1Q_0021310 [Alligator mississippiensis]